MSDQKPAVKGTATGRLAPREPNIQNIPIRTEIVRQIKEAFLRRK